MLNQSFSSSSSRQISFQAKILAFDRSSNSQPRSIDHVRRIEYRSHTRVNVDTGVLSFLTSSSNRGQKSLRFLSKESNLSWAPSKSVDSLNSASWIFAQFKLLFANCFLQGKAQIEQLLRYIVVEPLEDPEKRQTFKFPFIACEVDIILKTLVEDEELMNLLFSFLDSNHSHSTQLAGYFCKVVICLLLRKTLPFIQYVKGHQEIVKQLVDLIGITSIMEVLIRLIGSDEHMYADYMKSMQWIEDIDALEMIVDKFSSSDVYFDDESAEVVISSLRLGDDQESGSLFTNSNWFALEDNRVSNECSTGALASASPNKVVVVNGDGEDDEVVVGEEDELDDTATSSQVPDEKLEDKAADLSEDSKEAGPSTNDKPPVWVKWRETPDSNEASGSDKSAIVANGELQVKLVEDKGSDHGPDGTAEPSPLSSDNTSETSLETSQSTDENLGSNPPKPSEPGNGNASPLVTEDESVRNRVCP